jgi:4-methylaminobutanoate oxidase (formaldehyde-forming)
VSDITKSPVPRPEAIDAAWLEGSRFEVDLAGTRLAARVSLRSPFDPAGTRIKA